MTRTCRWSRVRRGRSRGRRCRWRRRKCAPHRTPALPRAPEHMRSHMLSNAINLTKTGVSYRLKIPVCSSWKIIAAHSNFKLADCCRVVRIFVQQIFWLMRKFSFENTFFELHIALLNFKFFETTSFYIFSTLTGDNSHFTSQKNVAVHLHL